MRQTIGNQIKIVSAIDVALENNQIGALSTMIDYIIENQNNFCYYNLFKDTLLSLIEKGIKVAPLLDSDIFCHSFEEADWPLIHIDNST
jgi:hypothetical protein